MKYIKPYDFTISQGIGDLSIDEITKLNDEKILTFVERNSSMTFDVSGFMLESIALLSIFGKTVSFDLINNGETTHLAEVELMFWDVANILDYLKQKRSILEFYLFTQIPIIFSDSTIRITITNNEGIVRVGNVVAGSLAQIGDTKIPYRIERMDYSRFVRIEEGENAGDIDFIKGNYAKRFVFTEFVDRERVEIVNAETERLQGKMSLFILKEDSVQIIYGMLKNSEMIFDDGELIEFENIIEGVAYNSF